MVWSKTVVDAVSSATMFSLTSIVGLEGLEKSGHPIFDIIAPKEFDVDLI